MNPLDYFSDPERGIMGIIIVVLGGALLFVGKLYLDEQKGRRDDNRALQIEIAELQEKLLIRADAYATKQESMAERTTTTISQLNELFRNGSKGV